MQPTLSDTGRPQDLLGHAVVVIGGSWGIRPEIARLARARGADVVRTGRNPDRLSDAAGQVDARSTAADIDGASSSWSSRGGTR